ncbi:hypothetical protein SEVIR_2G381800v4 [Setaria viridis]|uniref:ZCF37 n=1 Tax=Setaria viridis TaxID=4556 RepID=A0A4U6W242_SETVI|nr:uncharacterized protein LOC117845990 [Setaria viridis]TKW35564.1 hypothetical protein SEVIR_2G381800v2 [Setaria viridis]
MSFRSQQKVVNGMREMVFCGTGSFKDVDKEEGAGAGGKPDAAAKAKKAGGKAKGKDNPYASRGLDKFSTVLSELESKREKILRRAGPDADAGHLMVRFVQSGAKGWVPIVVKLPHEEEQQAADAKKRQSKPAKPTSRSSTPPTEPASPKEDPVKPVHVAPVPAPKTAVPAKKSKASRVRWSWAWGRKVRPCYYWPLAMALLLLSLVVFGRVFAICCTSIWWYLLPILSGEEALGVTRSPAAKARKDVGNKVGDKLAVAPPPSHGKKGSSGAAHEVISPRSHAHRKKG